MVRESKEVVASESTAGHAMRRVRIGKVAVNIAVGQSGEPLERARKILAQITDQTPCSKNARRTVKDWGIRKGEPISCMVTLRGERAESFVRNALEALSNRLSQSQFDESGNFGFGIKEHIEIPGTRYVPELGIVGMTVNVALERPGFRVRRRAFRRDKIGLKHRITRDEAIQFVKQKFPIEILGGDTNGETETA